MGSIYRPSGDDHGDGVHDTGGYTVHRVWPTQHIDVWPSGAMYSTLVYIIIGWSRLQPSDEGLVLAVIPIAVITATTEWPWMDTWIPP